MLVDLTTGELIAVRSALREYGRNPRNSRVKEEAEMYDAEILSADDKVSQALADTVGEG